MFRKKQEGVEEVRDGRYRVEHLSIQFMGSPEKASALLENALNDGDARGWKLLTVHPDRNAVTIVWDTEGA